MYDINLLGVIGTYLGLDGQSPFIVCGGALPPTLRSLDTLYNKDFSTQDQESSNHIMKYILAK